jgi:hypothetical protein
MQAEGDIGKSVGYTGQDSRILYEYSRYKEALCKIPRNDTSCLFAESV